MLSNLVYVIDDDKSIRDSTAFFLTSASYRVTTYASGPLFLKDFQELHPGCIILDIRMAEMDGFEVIKGIGSRREMLPVIVMTGHGDIATAVHAMRLGACDFMQKPFEESVLLEILDRQFEALSNHVVDSERRHMARVRIGQLTNRESEVLRGLAVGNSNKTLAFRLGLSTRTVEMHRTNMLDRLRVKTLPEALRLAFDAGIDILPDFSDSTNASEA